MVRSTFAHLGHQFIRLSPALTFLLFGTFPEGILAQQVSSPVTALLALLVILLVWSMAEGTIMLWYRARLSGPEGEAKSRGYLIVALLLGILLLPLLQIFRARVNEYIFVGLLTGLSLRGIARTSWEQHRELIGSISSFLAATTIAVLTFAIFRQSHHTPVPWQAILISLTAGALVLSVELVANTSAFPTALKWQNPLFRTIMFLGPVVVGAMAFLGQLPRCYAAVYLVIPLSQRAVRGTAARGHIAQEDLPKVVWANLGYILLLTLCRGYEFGWFN